VGWSGGCHRSAERGTGGPELFSGQGSRSYLLGIEAWTGLDGSIPAAKKMIPDLNDFCSPSDRKQKLEEKAAKAQEAFDKEAKAHKELQALFAKVQQEKNDLSSVLEGEKGNLADVHEKTNKLKAQKADLEAQLNVSFYIFFNSNPLYHSVKQK